MSATVRSYSQNADRVVGNTGLTIAKPLGIADGDVLVAFLHQADNIPTDAIFACAGWSVPTGKTGSGSIVSGTGNDMASTVLIKKITDASGEPANYTFTVSGNTGSDNMSGFIVCVQDAYFDDPVDELTQRSGTNDWTPTHVDITTGCADALILMFHAGNIGTAAAKTAGAPAEADALVGVISESRTVGNYSSAECARLAAGPAGLVSIGAWTGSPDDSASEYHLYSISIRPAGWEPPAFVPVQSNTATGNTIALTGVTPGNLIVIFLNAESVTGPTASVNDGTNDFIMATAANRADHEWGQFGYLLEANGGDVTYTINWPAGAEYKSVIIWEFSYSGIVIADDEAIGTGSSGAPTSANITTTGSADELVFGGEGNYSAAIASAHQINSLDAEDVVAESGSNRGVMWYRRFNAPFTGPASCSISSTEWVCNIISFKTLTGSGSASASASGAPDLIVDAGAIASAEAFGTPMVKGTVLEAGAIASAEALGTAMLMGILKAAGAIASAEALGTPALAGIIKEAGAIASAEGLGSPALRGTIAAAGAIATGEAFGSPLLKGLILAAGAIVTAEAMGEPALRGTIQAITGIPSEEIFGTPALRGTIHPSGIPTAEAFGDAELLEESGSASASASASGAPDLIVDVGAITSAEEFGTPSLRGTIQGISGISSAEDFGAPKINASIFGPGIPSAEALGTPQLNASIFGPGIPSAEAIGLPQLNASIFGPGIVSGESLGTPKLINILRATAIASLEAFGTPQINASIFGPGIPTEEAFGTARVVDLSVPVGHIYPVGISSAEVIGHAVLIDLNKSSVDCGLWATRERCLDPAGEKVVYNGERHDPIGEKIIIKGPKCQPIGEKPWRCE